MNIRDWVLQNLYKNGKINPTRCSVHAKSWLVLNHSHELKQIIEATKFLPDDSPVSLRIRVLRDGIKELPKCKNCDSPVSIHKGRLLNFCSRSCSNRLNSKTSNHISSPAVKAKIKSTMIKRYGVDNPFKSKEIIKKIVSNKDYTEIVKKTTKTCKERYGDNFYRDKWRKYNQRNISQETINKLEDPMWLRSQHEIYSLSEIARRLQISFTMVWQYSRKHNIETRKHTTTQIEYFIEEILKLAKVKYIKNDRSQLGGKELDFYIDELKLGIETHGIYWHSDKFKHPDHLKEKYTLASQNGIDLIQFTESDIDNNPEIVQSILLGRLNRVDKIIFARKCSIVELYDAAQIEDFYRLNHIQGPINSKINIGLFFENVLVSVMSFSKPRFSDHEFELTRFATILNTRVIGGASKLFSYFTKLYKPKSVVSYSDIQYFNGKVYKKLGFVTDHDTAPSYSYVVGKRLMNRMNFQKKLILKKFPSADLSMTEEALVLHHYGYRRFYHAGQRVHIWNNNEKTL